MKGKRCRDPLCEDTAHYMRYNSTLRPESCLLGGSKAKRELSSEMKINKAASMSISIKRYWNPKIKIVTEETDKSSEKEVCLITPFKKMAKGDSSNRKVAIKFIFENVLNSPEREEWKSKKVVQKIMEKLEMPEGSRNVVLSILEDSVAGIKSSERLSSRGRKCVITDFSEEANWLCDLFEKTDSSDSSVAALLNLRRIGKYGLTAKSVSRSAITSYRTRSVVLKFMIRNDFLNNFGQT